MATPFIPKDEVPECFLNLEEQGAPKEPIVEAVTEPIAKKKKKKEEEPVVEVKIEEPIDSEMILCVANVEQDTPYRINRGGREYVFNPPKFHCLLPKELAELYDSTKHTIRIFKGK